MIYDEKYWEDVKRVISQIPSMENLKNKAILVTGATGMIGAAVVELLAFLNKEMQLGIQILLAGRSEKRLEERFAAICDYQFVAFDLEDDRQLEATEMAIDYIIHAASNANPAVYVKKPAETLFGNVMGTKKLLDFAKGKQARLLFVSSSEVYGNKTSEAFYREEDYGFVDILNARACYPSGKRAAETLCAAYRQEYGIDFVVVRPGHIYGPTITETDSRASAQFSRSAARGEDIIMKSAGTQMRSYCYTLDCASAILTVLLQGQAGQAYNIANADSQITIRQVADLLAKASGTKVLFENPSDQEAKGYNLMDNSALDPERLEKLGWRAVFGAEEGMRRTIEILKLQMGEGSL